MLFAVQVTHLAQFGHLAVISISLLQFDTESNRYAELHYFIYQSDVSLSLSVSLSLCDHFAEQNALFCVCNYYFNSTFLMQKENHR